MKNNFVRLGIMLAVTVAASLCLAAQAVAADATTANVTVAKVVIKGNKQVTASRVKIHLKTQVRRPFDTATLRKDQQRLLKTGRFAKVDVTHRQTPRGVVVTFTVVENPLVGKITFTGNKAIDTKALLAETSLAVSDPIDSGTIAEAVRAIETHYKTEGFNFVKVTSAVEASSVILRIVEGPRVQIGKIRFKGNSYFRTFSLRFKTESSAKFWLLIDGYLDSEKVARDILSIRRVYVEDGFLDVEVAALLDYSADKKIVTLTYAIRENQRYKIAGIVFKGNKVFAPAELTKRLNLQKGEFYNKEAHDTDQEILKRAYGELGYIDAGVVATKRFKNKPGFVDLVYTLTEAKQFRLGTITIRGNDITKANVIRRQLRFFPGQLYNTIAVKESNNRLRELRLFETVDITPIGNAPGVRNALVHVTEGQTAEFMVGVGVSTSSGLVGNISLRQRNFDLMNFPKSWREFLTLQGFKGAGQTMEIVAEPGSELMRFHVGWFDPMVFDLPYSAGAKVFAFERSREEYDEARIGMVASLGYRHKNKWYSEIATRLEGIQISNMDEDAPPEVTCDDGDHLLVGIKGTLIRDRTDSRWLPSTGDRVRLSVEPVVGTESFTVLTAGYRYYRPLFTDALDRKHILATRCSFGYILGNAPVFERFYGGGAGSVRGFKYRGISPRSGGDPIGGKLMLFAGAEYTFPLLGEHLRGVVFLDTGTVEDSFTITTYRASIGAGVRWIVPIFGPIPMSFEFAVPLSKSDEDETQAFGFSLGMTF